MPCVSAVLPAPSGPTSTTRSPARSTAASSAPSARVSSTVGSTCSCFTARPDELGDPVQVGGERRTRSAVRPEPDRRRRVVGHVQRAPSQACGPASRTGEHRARAEEPLGRRETQRHDRRRVEELELSPQPSAAPRHLGRPRRPVARRPALHHVEHGGPAAVQSRRREQLVEQRARAADERPAGLVLRGAGSLADDRDQRPPCDRHVAHDDVCRVAASSGQARHPRADAARSVQSAAAAAAAATSSGGASSRGERDVVTSAPYGGLEHVSDTAGLGALPPVRDGWERAAERIRPEGGNDG